MVVDLQHTRDLKKAKQKFTLTDKSHNNHIHKKNAKHESK